MSKKTNELENVYGAESAEQIRNVYDNWAEKYDEENLRKGYRLATLGTGYVARHVPKGTGPILDAGCGTGLVGEALNILGYSDITGIDISPEMLAVAEGRGVYSKIAVQDLGEPLPNPNGSFAAFLCFASFGPGHAPVDCLDELVRVVRTGGHAIFNLREDTYVEQGFEAKMTELTVKNVWREVDRSSSFRPYLLAEPDLYARFFVYQITEE